MSSGDEQQWAPPGGETGPADAMPPAGRPAMPADNNPWAPPTPEPIRRPPVATTSSPEAAGVPPVEQVEVAAVEATAPPRRGAVGRVLAAGVAAVMLGGGAYLVVNAASAEAGAESPEAAFEAAMAAVEAEDVVALAEIMEPAERNTVFEAGFDFVDELVRLDVLDPGVDLSSIEGIDLEFEGFEPRVERPGNGLAHVYVGEGTISGTIDVAALPLGSLLVDRMDAEQLTFTDSAEETAGPSTTPLVAVERDGRWYLSLWYTVAENVRLEVGAGLPDLSLRPPTIGGETPEAAVRQMVDDAVRLDLGRIIGSFDPEEMAVLYDYAPLFLDDADAAASELLRWAADQGWTWEIVDLGLASEVDGDLATVTMESIHFRADAEGAGNLDVQVDADGFRVELSVVDEFFGDAFQLSARSDGECVTVTTDDGNGPTSERLCGDELGLDTEVGLGDLGEGLDELGLVTRRVDGIWYLSPMRTGLDAMITAIEQVDPAALEAFADGLLDFGLNGAIPTPDLESSLGLPGTTATDAFFEPFDPLAGVVNADLLAPTLEPSFVIDLDSAAAASELDLWVPELGALEVARGVYASVSASSGGEVAVVVLEVADPAAAATAIDTYISGAGLLVDITDQGTLIETVDFADDPLLIDWRGDRLTIAAVYGADGDAARQILADQLAGS